MIPGPTRANEKGEGAYFTVCVSVFDVLFRLFASPAYTTFMLCLPVVKVEMLKLATPDAFSVVVNRVVLPSLSEADPVAMALVEVTTVAVKVTDNAATFDILDQYGEANDPKANH